MKDHRIGRAMGFCKKVVSAFSYSWKKKRELTDVQKRLNLPEHSQTDRVSNQVVDSAGYDGQGPRAAEGHRRGPLQRHLTPSWQDVDVLAINNSLSPLVEFTDVLSGEQLSVSFVKPTLHLFNNSILTLQENGTDLAKCIKKKIVGYLNEKHDDAPTQELLDMTSALDPRFKPTYVSEDKRGSIEERLI